MKFNEVYFAVVKKNDSQLNLNTLGEKTGAVQVYVESFMSGYTPTDYPWVYPITEMGGSKDSGDVNVPEIDSVILVWFEKDRYKKNGFYLGGVTTGNINATSLFTTAIKSTIGSASSYPDLKFKAYPNGVIIGVDSSPTNEEVFIRTTKTFVIIKNDGSVEIDAGGDIDITAATVNIDGDLNVTGDTIVDGEVTAKAQTTNVSLSTHSHTSGAPGTPTSPPTTGT